MVMAAWGGGAYDSKRNRLIVWGGGHGDYKGNEVYVLDLNANPIVPLRLNEPGQYSPDGTCHDTQPGHGQDASSRHTYEALAYLPTQDALFDMGGAQVDSGCLGNNVNWFNLAGLAWAQKIGNVSGWNSGIPVCDYDPNRDQVLCFNNNNGDLWIYNPTANTMTLQSPSSGGFPTLDVSGVLDYTGKRFYIVGGGYMGYYDVSGTPPFPVRVDMTIPGSCTTFASGHYPGLQYDSAQKLLVEWHGGDAVNTYNPATNTCNSVTFTGGPGPQQANGTHGRFRYVPSLGVFVLANSWVQNVSILRLTNGAPPPPPSSPVITSAGSATGTVGIAFNYQITATNSPISFNATGLPAGLSVNANTGLISGTPTIAGTSSVALSASNAGGTGNATLTLTINPGSLDTTPPSVPTGLSATAASSTQINLNWNASTDNIGVAGYKIFRGGSQIATSASTSFQDIGLAANTAYTYTVAAYDAAGNTSAQSASASVTTLSSGGTTPDADFAARCAAPGVLNCQGFDTATIFTTAVDQGARTDGFTTATHPNLTRDTSVFLSGGSSAHFFIPAGAGENDTGNYWAFFGQGSNNKFFGLNSTFYVQYAFRADSAWTSTDWTQYGPSGDNTSPKLSIFHNVEAGSCASEEVTTHNHNGRDLPAIYTNCGSPSATTGADGHTWDGSDAIWQQGWNVPLPDTGYECDYGTGNFTGPNCFHFAPNQWYTIYFKVHVGSTWGSPGSTIEAWVAPYGQQMKKLINVLNNFTLNADTTCDGSPADTGAGSQPCHGFDLLELSQFMTGKIPGTGPAANVWYDELIVSQQPIAAPGGTLPPADTTPPTLAITAPANGAMVSGMINVTGTASDNVGVVGVQFKLDGANLGSENTAAPYTVSWNTAGASNGSHTLTAVARDAAGNIATASNVTVTVNNTVADTTPPSVPTGLFTTAISSNQIKVAWNPSTDNVGVTGYKLFRCQGLSCTPTVQISTPAVASLSDNGLLPATTYTYAVSAFDAAGNASALSGGVKGVTLPVTAPANQPPVVSTIGYNAVDIDPVTPGLQVYENSSVTYTGSATDPNNNPLTWQWIYTVNGGAETVMASGSGAVQPLTFNYGTGAKTYVWILRVSDGQLTSQSTLTVGVIVRPDTTPPTLSITSPVNNATVSGTVNVTGTASDNVGVVGMQFKLDGANLGAEDTASPYSVSWNTTGASNGSHTLTAIARDAAGNLATAANIIVTVNNTINPPPDTTPPTVSLASLSTTTVSGTVSLTALASDNVGVASVQFKLDGNNLGNPLTSAPFTLSWNSAQASAGQHTITAVARDAAGNTTTSTPIVVNVIQGADATAGLRSALVYPNPAVKTDPVVRAYVGSVNSVEITIYDTGGHVVNSTTLTGAPTGISNGQYYYDYAWTGHKSSGIYFAVIHGKAMDGTIIRARVKFAVVQ